MASKIKTRQITLVDNKGTFKSFFRRFSGEKKDYDFEGLKSLRKILSNEKARALHLIKHKHPRSIYDLSRLLKRDFKSVNEDIKLLERFGFIDLVSEKTGKRARLKPVVVVDAINIEIKI